ncbi:hypothetical protein ACFFYR_38395 [Paraburkholderia dipogonis]|uniref:hypothetical protein n=1 Tax=Paraburkholderia dipogonis TaxID=1211383 RepID=UPI0035E6C794
MKVLNGLLEIRTGRLKKQDAGMIALNRCELNSLRRENTVGVPHDAGMTIAWEPAYTSQ